VTSALALLLATVGTTVDDGRTEGALALLALAVVTSAAGLLLTGLERFLAHAAAPPLLAGAALAFGADLTTLEQRPLVVAAVGLLAVLAAAQLPRRWRDGPVVGALATSAATVLALSEQVMQALLLPATWLDRPWTLAVGRDARQALSPNQAWDGTVVTPVVVAAAAVAVGAAGLALHRVRLAIPVAGGLAVLAGALLPLGLATSYAMALVLLLALAVALTFVVDLPRRFALEAAAAVLGLTSVALAHGDAGWLSWVLAALAVLALADALHADRRPVAAGGALLLSASSWVRLLDADVRAPEPYVVPLALVALALGYARRRRDPEVRSFAAYGAALTALLVPSLLASFDDDTLTRPLLLGAAALVVLLVGARERLQAPLVVGGAVLAVDALHQLAPYAGALPRWLTLGAVGLLLVGVGATYEQRRRDVTRLREAYDALA
jgi:hypothetical protein